VKNDVYIRGVELRSILQVLTNAKDGLTIFDTGNADIG